MKFRENSVRFLSILFPIVFVAVLDVSHAATLTNGSLTINIRNDNGAIDDALFGGSDYFNPGTSVSNWGLQNESSTSTFVSNTTDGITPQPVSVTPSPGLVVVGGTYTAGGANVSFVRNYSLVAGFNVLRVETQFQNNGSNLSLRYFDTFDPDQGVPTGQGFDTFNDVFLLGGNEVGQARIEGISTNTVIAGSPDSRAVVAAGSPFGIFNGFDLNSFFNSPFDGNDAFADQGLHIGFESILTSGGTDSFTYFLSFGSSPTAAQNDYIGARDASVTSVIPEPTSALALSGLLSAGLLLRSSKKCMRFVVTHHPLRFGSYSITLEKRTH